MFYLFYFFNVIEASRHFLFSPHACRENLSALNFSQLLSKDERGKKKKDREQETVRREYEQEGEKKEEEDRKGHIKVNGISTSFILQESTCFNLP